MTDLETTFNMNSNDSLVDKLHTNKCSNEKTKIEYKVISVEYWPTESIKDEDIKNLIEDPTLKLVIVAETKMSRLQDHQFIYLWVKKIIEEMMIGKAREYGLQDHRSPLQNMKDLGQCWTTRDGSTKNVEQVWFVLYGMFGQDESE